MAIGIGSNTASLKAQRAVGTAAANLSDIYEKLSSGQRINSASDDAAGLAISSGLNLDARVFAQAIRNVNDGISALSIAQQGLSQLSNITIRQKELAEQSANGSFSSAQRAALDKEAKELTSEYNRIVQTTKFNGRQLYADASNSLSLQSGKTGNDFVSIDIGSGLVAETSSEGVNRDLALSSGRTENYTAEFSSLQMVESFDIQITLDYGGGGAGSTYGTGGPMYLDGVSIGFNVDGYCLGGFDSTITLNGYTAAADVASAIASQFSSPLYFASLVSSDTVRFYSTSMQDKASSSPGPFGTEVANAYSSGGILDLAEGSYLSFSVMNGSGSADDYYVYFTKSAGNNDPALTGRTGIEVAIDYTTLSAEDLVQAAVSAISSALPGQVYAYSGGSGNLLIENLESGDLLDSASSIGGVNVNGVAGDVHVANDSFTYTSHGLSTGDAIRLSDTGGAPGNLSTGVDYYVIKIDDNNFKLASSYANALTSSAIDIVSIGSGTQTFSLSIPGSSSVSSIMIDDIDLTSASTALQSLDTLETRQQNIALEMGKQGSFESRLNVVLQTLQSSRENSLAAASRITDADIASESANLVRTQILQNTATAVLAQANQQPGIAISLLRQL